MRSICTAPTSPRGNPLERTRCFFVSSKSRWQDGVAIRGGVPICFPWFGDKADDPKAPAHGFVRTKSWQLDAIALSGDAVTVSMSTGSDEGTKQWWPADFRLIYRATFGAELTLELELHNIGHRTSAFRRGSAFLLPSGGCSDGAPEAVWMESITSTRPTHTAKTSNRVTS